MRKKKKIAAMRKFILEMCHEFSPGRYFSQLLFYLTFHLLHSERGDWYVTDISIFRKHFSKEPAHPPCFCFSHCKIEERSHIFRSEVDTFFLSNPLMHSGHYSG